MLFSLNLLDAILTIIWVRSGVAPEGNQLMAHFLDMSDLSFLGVKIAIGTFAAIVLLRWGNRKLAKYGVAVAIAVYVSVMGVHLLTYLSAIGYVSSLTMQEFPHLGHIMRAAL